VLKSAGIVRFFGLKYGNDAAIFGRATQCSAAFAIGMSVRLSVCLRRSHSDTRESHLNGSRWRNAPHTVQ